MNFHSRKEERKNYYKKYVYGWKQRKCTACNGSGYYDHNGSPNCGGCEGTGKEMFKSDKSVMNRDKIQGMILGVAIGDSLGMPVETWGRDRILQKYPEGIKKYEKPDGHKWFSGQESGTITDDTQLTMAVIEGIIKGNGFNLNSIAESHVKAMKETTSGWGNTTRNSVRRLSNGVSYKESSETNDFSGIGNGVPMKISPIAVLAVINKGKNKEETFYQKIIELSYMTHCTKKSAYAALIHTTILKNCLINDKNTYDIKKSFFKPIEKLFQINLNLNHLKDYQEKENSYEDLFKSLNKSFNMTYNEIAEKYKGSCYVYESLGYTYAHWIKNHHNIDVLYDSINYGINGNDADSNASMIGAMLGALHGKNIFESQTHLIDGLKDYDKIMKLTNIFCDSLDIP